MISYCVAAYRPTYARMLLADLIEKTRTPFEILLWLNVCDAELEADIESARAKGADIRVLGRTPENIGMLAYVELFRAARYPLITQIDDDVVCISPGIAERAARLFEKFPRVRQIVADVWQDEHTTGARPPLEQYRLLYASEQLYSGPIDGWFSIYHRSVLPVLVSTPVSQYCNIGSAVSARLRSRGLEGVLDCGMKVFHVIGPHYAAAFGMLDFEIEKYRRLGRKEIVEWYEQQRPSTQEVAAARAGVRDIAATLR